MLYFPQLSTGTLVQYPLLRSCRIRTISAETVSGRRISLADPASSELAWRIQMTGLTRSEMDSVEALFAAAQGRLRRFTWLDPTTNLLTWSQDFVQPAWDNGGLLTLTEGQSDPLGGTEATQVVNVTSGTQALRQVVAARSDFQYCFSVYVRASAPVTIAIAIAADQSDVASDVTVTPQWRRVSIAGKLTVPGDTLTAEMRLPAATSVQIFGAQLDAQRQPSPYNRTSHRSGVWTGARFDADTLTVTAEGVDSFSASFGINVSTEE